jgi:hypothetical protein
MNVMNQCLTEEKNLKRRMNCRNNMDGALFVYITTGQIQDCKTTFLTVQHLKLNI